MPSKRRILRWFGHKKKRNVDSVNRRVLEMELDGERKRGRSRHRWKNSVTVNMEEVGLKEQDAKDRKMALVTATL